MTLKRLRVGTLGCVSRSCPWREVVGKWWGAALTPACPPQLSQQSHCPDFFLFLCRLLSPLLKAFAQAAAFLHQGQLPDTESGYTEQLFQFLQATAQEEEILGESQPVSPGSWRQGCLLVVAAPCRTVNPTLGRRLQSSEGLLSKCADRKLAISAIWTFRDLGVLQQMPSPAGPRLHLSPTFASRENQQKLEQFIRQFICS
nr:glycerol-3-phosphate acyltransferase 2, mitochondrial-like [Chlorocebus sabaeus]